MSKFKKIFLFALISLFPAFILAQTSCNEKLKLAKELFESGQIEKIPELLDSCLIKGFGKSEENQAYRLLMQAYLFDYNRDKAMEVMFRFLKKYPSYKFTSSDPIEIKEIFDIYKVNPNWGFGIYAGSNLSNVKSIQNYSVFNLNSLSSDYTKKIGYNIGLFAEKYFGTHYILSIGVNMKKLSYQNLETSSDNFSVQFTDKSTWLSVPLSFSYYLMNRKLSPFIYTGIELDYLLKSNGDFITTFQESPENIIQSGASDLSKFRKPFNCYVIGGLGLQYEIPKGSLKLWLGYNYSLLDYINKDKRYASIDNIMNYKHIDDDIVFNHFTIAFTYTRILFKIKAKENHATK